MDRKIDDLNPILSKITRLVAAIKSLRFALLILMVDICCHDLDQCYLQALFASIGHGVAQCYCLNLILIYYEMCGKTSVEFEAKKEYRMVSSKHR